MEQRFRYDYRTRAGEGKPDVEFPVFGTLTHGFVIAADAQPQRAAQKQAIGQLVGTELFEQIELFWQYPGLVSLKRNVGEDEGVVGVVGGKGGEKFF